MLVCNSNVKLLEFLLNLFLNVLFLLKNIYKHVLFFAYGLVIDSYLSNFEKKNILNLKISSEIILIDTRFLITFVLQWWK